MEYLEEQRHELHYFYFTLIDIMFLPYLFHLPIKLSMITILIWLFRKNNGTNLKFNLNLLSFIFLGLASVCVGLFKGYIDTKTIFTNVQTLVIVLYGYACYEYVKVTKQKYNIELTDMFIFYLGIAFIFMLLYWFNPSLFFDIRPFWTLQETGEIFDSYGGNRFTFLVSEPNNFAALVVGIMALLLTDYKMEINEKFVIVVISACLVISTSSNSGVLYFVGVLIYCLFTRKKNKNYSANAIKSSFRKVFMYFATVVALLFIVFTIVNIGRLMQTDLIETASNRYKIYVNDEQTDYSGLRQSIWLSNINERNLIEYIILGDAGVGRPHSGHLYLIFAFGCIAYCLFIRCFLFDNVHGRRAVIIRGVFFAVFTMNTFIVDLRAFTLFVVLLGLTSKKSNLIGLNSTKKL